MIDDGNPSVVVPPFDPTAELEKEPIAPAPIETGTDQGPGEENGVVLVLNAPAPPPPPSKYPPPPPPPITTYSKVSLKGEDDAKVPELIKV
jgi:hypothetical protein